MPKNGGREPPLPLPDQAVSRSPTMVPPTHDPDERCRRSGPAMRKSRAACSLWGGSVLLLALLRPWAEAAGPNFGALPSPGASRRGVGSFRDGRVASPWARSLLVPRPGRAWAALAVSGGGAGGTGPSGPTLPSEAPVPGLAEEVARGLSSVAAPRGGSTSVEDADDDDVAAALPDEGSPQAAEQPEGGRKKKSRKQRKEEELGSAAQYAKKLKNRNRTNIKRKILHSSFGLFFAGLHHVLPRERFVPGMFVLTSICLTTELLRYRKGFGWINDVMHFILGDQLRKHEMEGKFTGSFYYFFGVTMTAWLFPRSAASFGIAQLAIADPTASFFGRHTRHVYWSRIEGGLGGIGRNKGFLGFLGGALCCIPYNYRVLSLAKWGAGGIPGGKQSLLVASLALGMAGAFADLAVPTPAVVMPKKIMGIAVPPFHIDDNFVVPIFSGWACTKIFDLLDWSDTLELGKYILF